ncbi:glutaredoxin family protein [Patescibacteria group bacterium]|nr:glutaredoxin family protein [Patescibacteria group bacterium]
MKKFLWGSWVVLGVALFAWWYGPAMVGVQPAPAPVVAATASSDGEVKLLIFGRDDCGFCKKQFAWLETTDLPYEYLNIKTDPEAKALFDQLTAKHEISQVTPITVVGERVIVGFNAPETTGLAIKEAYSVALTGTIRTIEEHLSEAPKQSVTSGGGGCSDISCDQGSNSSFVFDLPLLGIVDLQSFSLFTLSLVLGTIDGFNPCAMWVLVTFCVLLSQAGSRRKMVFLAGLFMLAEGIMYNLILNVWYKTWDFVALDQIVTPLVGFLALGGGAYFLWRWYKNREAALVCDVTDLETQGKVIARFKAIANQPITALSIISIIGIAFSVNVIEFACSIGIPQAYTKILEMNMLTFMERQWYLLVYTAGYMVDDVIVFGLAIWGYGKLQALGGKYANLSLLIGGLLMLALGSILAFNPELLVW